MNQIAVNQIMFLDIETAPQYESYNTIPGRMRDLWDKKVPREKDEDPVLHYHNAGLYAEFGKIVCISIGVVNKNQFLLYSYYGEDEKLLLMDFSAALSKFCGKEGRYVCAHNGKGFDFPFIARRCLINDLPIPYLLNVMGLKPWEIPHLDTMEMWKFGQWGASCSLDLLTACFDIPSPKEDISGGDVWYVYWVQKDYTRIAQYCEKDVSALFSVYLRLVRENPNNYIITQYKAQI